MRTHDILTAEQSKFCSFLLPKLLCLLLYRKQKTGAFGHGATVSKRAFQLSSGTYSRMSSTRQSRISQRSFRVAVEMLRLCFRESRVPRLKE